MYSKVPNEHDTTFINYRDFFGATLLLGGDTLINFYQNTFSKKNHTLKMGTMIPTIMKIILFMYAYLREVRLLFQPNCPGATFIWVKSRGARSEVH